MRDRFFGGEAVLILQRGDSLEGPRTMQVICPSDFLRFFDIIGGHNPFPCLCAIWTGVNTRIRRSLASSPQERIHRDFISTFFARCEIERLQMRAEPFIPFFYSN